jgi:anti-sigma regulatory factor (Ser/Thr protein kinase)
MSEPDQSPGPGGGSSILPRRASSVPAARRFVAERLTDLARDDLLYAARLGVSELVTNAVLHAAGDAVEVHVAPEGDTGGVRIGVRDGYPVPPLARRPGPDVAVGRGLRLVESLSRSWGVRVEAAGKVVWFVPLPDGHLDLGATPATAAAAAPGTTPDDPWERWEPVETERSMAVASSRYLREHGMAQAETVQMRLLRLPLREFAALMVAHRELMREVNLVMRRPGDVAGDEGAGAVLPDRLVALAAELEEFRGVGAQTEAVRDAALARGETEIDLTYHLPVAAGPPCARLLDLLEEADAFCRKETLLTLAPPPGLLELRAWFLTEVVRQCAGEPPVPWPDYHADRRRV